MKRSFDTLDPKEALHTAIFIEERNADLYQRFAEMFLEFGDNESLEIAEVFGEMAIEEKLHSSLLQAKYTEFYGNANCAITEEELIEFIEVPALAESDIFAFSDGLQTPTPRERAIRVALEAEVSAQNYYAGLAQTTSDEALRYTYRDLAQMEDGHVTFLEAKLVNDAANHKLPN